jgi:hypothetical protein
MMGGLAFLGSESFSLIISALRLVRGQIDNAHLQLYPMFQIQSDVITAYELCFRQFINGFVDRDFGVGIIVALWHFAN